MAARAVTLDRVQIAAGASPTADQLNRLQTNMEKAVATLTERDTMVVVKFSVANTDTRLFHQLGRPFVGARLVRATAAMSIYDGAPSTDPNHWANLKSSAVGTATFEVY